MWIVSPGNCSLDSFLNPTTKIINILWRFNSNCNFFFKFSELCHIWITILHLPSKIYTLQLALHIMVLNFKCELQMPSIHTQCHSWPSSCLCSSVLFANNYLNRILDALRTEGLQSISTLELILLLSHTSVRTGIGTGGCLNWLLCRI